MKTSSEREEAVHDRHFYHILRAAAWLGIVLECLFVSEYLESTKNDAAKSSTGGETKNSGPKRAFPNVRFFKRSYSCDIETPLLIREPILEMMRSDRALTCPFELLFQIAEIESFHQ